MAYDPETTALLLVDPYNDFLHENGKTWPRVKEVAEQVRLMEHLRILVAAARASGVKVAFVPHHRHEPGDLAKWRHATPYQRAAAQRLVFERGTWGGTFHDDF